MKTQTVLPSAGTPAMPFLGITRIRAINMRKVAGALCHVNLSAN